MSEMAETVAVTLSPVVELKLGLPDKPLHVYVILESDGVAVSTVSPPVPHIVGTLAEINVGLTVTETGVLTPSQDPLFSATYSVPVAQAGAE